VITSQIRGGALPARASPAQIASTTATGAKPPPRGVATVCEERWFG
jgi:hypothetical protein